MRYSEQDQEVDSTIFFGRICESDGSKAIGRVCRGNQELKAGDSVPCHATASDRELRVNCSGFGSTGAQKRNSIKLRW